MTTFLLIWKMNFVWRPHLSSTKDFLRPFCPLVPCSILNHSGWKSIKKSHFQTYTSKSSYFSFSNKIWSLRYFWYFSTTVQQSDKNVWDWWITQTFLTVRSVEPNADEIICLGQFQTHSWGIFKGSSSRLIKCQRCSSPYHLVFRVEIPKIGGVSRSSGVITLLAKSNVLFKSVQDTYTVWPTPTKKIYSFVYSIIVN